jgi:ankyrin repeat protein
MTAIALKKGPHLALMLDSGGDPNMADGKGQTPLIAAIRLGWRDGIAALLDHRADANLPNRGGETPLIAAVQERDVPTVRRLLGMGADPDRADHVAGFSARDYAHRDERVRDLSRLVDAVPKR